MSSQFSISCHWGLCPSHMETRWVVHKFHFAQNTPHIERHHLLYRIFYT